MNHKILFLDYDETLLCSDKSVTAENRKALLAALEAGHYLAFTTGRPLHGAKVFFDRLDLPRDHCYLLCYQGCVLYDLARQETVMSKTMDSDALGALIALLQERDIYYQAFALDRFYCPAYTEVTRRYCENTRESYEVLKTPEQLLEQKIYKVMAIDFYDRRPLAALQQQVTSDPIFPFQSFFSSPWFYEFCAKGQDKGSGLRYLADVLCIPRSDTIAVGDEENDIPMIEAAGIGVAMCNARDEIKAHADVVTTRDNNHSGVAEVIRRYLL